MHKHLIPIALLAAMVVPIAAAEDEISVIPQPLKMVSGSGHFSVTAQTSILIEAPAANDAATSLTAHLENGAGLKLSAKQSDADAAIGGAILITTKGADPALGDEGYTLDVTPDSVLIRAPRAAGLFYGVQTLLQLLPPAIESASPRAGIEWSIPSIHIEDKPRFRWRGLMLDVSRHFEPTEVVLGYLDQMAMHKLNVFHWHLTDDQGWRIEIKKYPRLTEVGAWRKRAGFDMDPKLSTTYNAAGQYGGFYTQDDVKEVVARAAQLHIMVVPEIEMPGHATAALAAYPKFACSAGPFTIDDSAGIFQGIYDPANEKTYTFLEDILGEVMGLFPSPYIHVGGDEVPKEPWQNNAGDRALMEREHLKSGEELQSYFMSRIGKFLAAHGRHMVGWDEILEGGLAPDATVMSWRGTKGGLAAAQADHDVVMSPTSNCYLDAEQGIGTEPHERGAMLTVQKAYDYEPVPEGLSTDRLHHVLGVQGNLWTEYVPNGPWVEYMTWPRGAALAEVGWSEPARRTFEDFAKRLPAEQKRLDAMGVNYRPIEDSELTGAVHLSKDKHQRVIVDPLIPDATIHYTIDGTFPAADSPTYTVPIALPQGFVHVTARYFRDGIVATPVAAAAFLDGRPVHVTTTTGADWQSRGKYFFTPRWGIGADDSITVIFDDGPQQLRSITVQSGDPAKPGSNWQHGTLETSSDGKAFDSSADFNTDGTAKANCADKPVAAFRITLKASQKPNPVIQSVTLQ